MKTLITFLFVSTFTFGIFAQTKPAPKMIYWTKDCDICDQITDNGATYFIFFTPEFTLAVRGVDAKKAIYAEIYLKNESRDPKNRIEFNPSDSRVAVFVKRDDKTPIELVPMSPEKAADKLDGSSNAKLKNFFQQWGANMVTQQARGETTTTGTVRVTDSQGNTGYGDYSANSQTTVTVPDREAQARANQSADARKARVEAKNNSIMQSVLRANTLFAGDDITGNIYFPSKKGEFIYVAVKVGDAVYVKGFNLSPKK